MLADRVLVQMGQAEGERRSRAGILIPATAQVSRRLAWAEAVAVGPHVRSVKVGDRGAELDCDAAETAAEIKARDERRSL